MAGRRTLGTRRASLCKALYFIANGLLDVYAKGLVHGSLSSHNVFVSSPTFIQVGVPGTRLAAAVVASDVYAFGILTSELNAFQLPFDDYDFDDEVALTTAVVDGGLRPTLREKRDDWYRDLVGRCVDADPLNRPTAQDALLWCSCSIAFVT
ncbi:hypothetical protein SDRG_15390 [Saprolegnia diclina VS20]|uniref:Protein kinase domain-containing protein n=1 Tax=Saprolegnia diclina (strain VS20) TaxID=1156394 RepID=T0PX18_SAPDV|nr:hypothetical protein SDRG_15390 [Saprolegnia diclina VS20]EQC26801.1 hypothetical protein SDRG_15390 [Saprolegnia diclina VS20]|eukprot:XP_008619783.1 hypothetical protein SDRG_15390 [Saprolegnia diclina VS20]